MRLKYSLILLALPLLAQQAARTGLKLSGIPARDPSILADADSRTIPAPGLASGRHGVHTGFFERYRPQTRFRAGRGPSGRRSQRSTPSIQDGLGVRGPPVFRRALQPLLSCSGDDRSMWMRAGGGIGPISSSGGEAHVQFQPEERVPSGPPGPPGCLGGGWLYRRPDVSCSSLQ